MKSEDISQLMQVLEDIADSIRSGGEEGKGFVGAVDDVAFASRKVASAIYPNGVAGSVDAAGIKVESLTEAVMGVTAALVRIANAMECLADNANVLHHGIDADSQSGALRPLDVAKQAREDALKVNDIRTASLLLRCVRCLIRYQIESWEQLKAIEFRYIQKRWINYGPATHECFRVAAEKHGIVLPPWK